mmetsp:Transcript_42353/g.78936  ORF Transcript_42353/g.78936 Transcript_42353/m.78936 type:complete len:87 (+) Transcript_42353:50-310(+)
MLVQIAWWSVPLAAEGVAHIRQNWNELAAVSPLRSQGYSAFSFFPSLLRQRCISAWIPRPQSAPTTDRKMKRVAWVATGSVIMVFE